MFNCILLRDETKHNRQDEKILMEKGNSNGTEIKSLVHQTNWWSSKTTFSHGQSLSRREEKTSN